MATDLEPKIVKQVEYYFGNVNLPRDKFLQEKIKEDDGWVTLETLLTFKRLAGLSTDTKVIAEALEKVEDKLVLVSEDKTKVKRNPEKPLPENQDEHVKQLQARSAYAKGFPQDEQLHDIINFMEPHGSESVIRRTTKDHKFKGSCFIVFKTLELAKKFVAEESVKYKDTELVRKMQNQYYADKKKEIEEHKQKKKEKKEQIIEESAKEIEFPNGAIVHFKGISDADKDSLTREELKEKLKDAAGDLMVVYIDYNKGDTEGFARFGKENQASEFLKKLTDAQLKVNESELTFRVLEGDEEKEYLKKTSESMVRMRQRKQQGKGQKRKGGNFERGRKPKHSRKDDDSKNGEDAKDDKEDDKVDAKDNKEAEGDD